MALHLLDRSAPDHSFEVPPQRRDGWSHKLRSSLKADVALRLRFRRDRAWRELKHLGPYSQEELLSWWHDRERPDEGVWRGDWHDCLMADRYLHEALLGL
ncbi:hypothetical protein [Mumia zhuanghuii]|uniref:Uncharacterized protein n=1 Tax=Mumia zhuanghuii TaxID=2585211 RepID=A0A5C4MB34_9ACTN|nr:hypothetical protein [Mumia zhuanghuii]TNC33521.1 hypothetical protein FHE65_28950 [Mumia zhuanghuii]